MGKGEGLSRKSPKILKKSLKKFRDYYIREKFMAPERLAYMH
jgi:hypothetical protein